STYYFTISIQSGQNEYMPSSKLSSLVFRSIDSGYKYPHLLLILVVCFSYNSNNSQDNYISTFIDQITHQISFSITGASEIVILAVTIPSRTTTYLDQDITMCYYVIYTWACGCIRTATHEP